MGRCCISREKTPGLVKEELIQKYTQSNLATMASPNAGIERIAGSSDLIIIETSNDLKTVTDEDADLALQVYNNIECTEGEVFAVDDKKLLRKIDFHMLPIVRSSMLSFQILH